MSHHLERESSDTAIKVPHRIPAQFWPFSIRELGKMATQITTRRTRYGGVFSARGRDQKTKEFIRPNKAMFPQSRRRDSNLQQVGSNFFNFRNTYRDNLGQLTLRPISQFGCAKCGGI